MGLIKGKQIEDGSISANKIDTTNGAISTVNGGDAAVEGSGTGVARRDHQHAVSTGGATSGLAIGDAAAEGASAALAREDHQHAFVAPAAPEDVTATVAATGVSTTVARADHKHNIATAIPVAVGAALAIGASASMARADHVHTHGNQAGGVLHSDVTIGTAGFMSATDKIKLDAMQDASGVDAKESVRVRTQGNHALSGLSLIDGITPLIGDRILVDAQTTVTQDGIYIAAAGAWSRSDDMVVASEARGALIHVEEGAADADKLFQCTNNAGADIVGTDGLTFSQIGAGSPRAAGAGLVLSGNDLDVVANADASIVVNANDIQVGVLATDAQHGLRGGGTQHAIALPGGAAGFMSGADKTKLDGLSGGTPRQESITTQAIAGTDTTMTDTLSFAPSASLGVSLYLNHVFQEQGAGLDYTLTGQTITWLAASGGAVDQEASDSLIAVYTS